MKKIDPLFSAAILAAAIAGASAQSLTSQPVSTLPPTTAATMVAAEPSTSPATTSFSSRASTAPTSRGAFVASTGPAAERASIAPLPRRSPTTAGLSNTESLLAQRPPQDIPPAPPLAREFSILSRRSIFIKGVQTVPDGSSRESGPRNYTPPNPEQNLIFDGGTKSGEEIYAMLEDRSNGGRISVVKTGERVASGRITSITLDGVDYEANGQTHHIGIGQNLQGTQVNGPNAVASLSGSGSTSSGAPIPTTGPTAITPGLSTEDIIERLRRRRAQESGH